jgi:hypothetical protein
MEDRAVLTGVEPTSSNDFSERLVDGFFRRWYLYLIPVLLLTAVGVNNARTIVGDYVSYARLSATTNPYLSLPDVRGTELPFWEPPAEGTARLINDQLRTDAFIDEIAARAGLSGAVSSGLVTRDVIRSRVQASAAGQNNLSVSATWPDPQTAFEIADAVATGYGDYLNDLAVADGQEAVRFWTERRETADEAAAQAEESLNAFISALPPLADGEERAEEQLLQLERLSAELDRALIAVREVQTAIDEAQFNANQAGLESARGLLVIDPPTVPSFPEPIRRDQLLSVVTFMVLGCVIAMTALVVTTVTDRSVRTRSQLRMATGVDLVTVVPRSKQRRRVRRQEAANIGRAA